LPGIQDMSEANESLRRVLAGLRKQRRDHQPLLVGQVRRVSPELASDLSRTATRLGSPHTKLESRHLIAGKRIFQKRSQAERSSSDDALLPRRGYQQHAAPIDVALDERPAWLKHYAGPLGRKRDLSLPITAAIVMTGLSLLRHLGWIP
jgi:hypothetical protein